jgi:predicted porin
MSRTNKKLLIASAAAVLGLPFAAQAQSNVQVYGKLYPQVTNYKLSGATARGTSLSTLTSAPSATTPADGSGTAMESSHSRLGFRGTENLGNNLKVLFQLEMAIGIDDGEGAVNGVLFNRDTFVGLNGGFGTIRFGNIDTVYKRIGDRMPWFGISPVNFVSTSNILSKPGLGTNVASSFHLRRNNSIAYETPVSGGFQGLFYYALGEDAANFRSKAVVSVGVTYAKGPLYAALAHEQHNDLFGGSRNVAAAVANLSSAGAVLPGVTAADTGTRLTLAYRFPAGPRVEANVARLDYDESGGAVGRFHNYNTTTWSLGADQKIGAFNLSGSYGQAAAGSCTLVGGVACNTTGMEGKMLNLGVAYSLSKRTALYSIFSEIKNGASAKYSNVGDPPRPATGQDIRQFALGIVHDF